MPKVMQPSNPPSLPKPAGFAHAWEVQGGKTVHMSGQVAMDKDGRVVGKGDLVAQFRQVCENLKAIVTASAGQMSDIVKLTVFVLSKTEYKARGREIGVVYREYFGRHYPAMTLVEVRGLYDDDCLLEIEGIAVI
ncbi:MAG: RidA family protein [Candidatus Rokuibacteriota bacterium]|jgi:enamine deaminase RidA (YjgF/YER057c/UK114 family)